MQPDHLDVVDSDDLRLPSVPKAREAWFRGDFDSCLTILDGAQPSSEAEQREALLLRARALLRLRQPASVVELLGSVLDTFVGVDEACTARMLHGEAIAKAQDADRGLALLLDLYNASFALNAHTAIRGEIAYKVALAYWMKRDFRPTLEYATIAEAARADIISVRASFLRGFVAAAKEKFHQALALFKSALRAYQSCRERDEDLMELIVVQIAALEVSLRSTRVHGGHDLPAGVGTRVFDVSELRAPGVSRMQLAALDSWLFAFDGERDKAYRLARVAVGLAPSEASRTWAFANRAQICLCFGDIVNAREFAAEAVVAADRVRWEELDGEERVALLLLVEALVVTEPAAAIRVMERYENLTLSVDKTLLMHDEVRLWILETFARGLVQRARGDLHQAWQSFKRVYDAALRVGIIWRAAAALIELDETPTPGRPPGDHYLQAAALLVRDHFPRSFLERRLGRWSASLVDPVVARLAPRPREVMRHLLAGRNPKEIAVAMGLAEGTVQTYVKVLHGAFGVHSTPELLVDCYRRGIGDPTWWSVLDQPNAPPIAGERAPKYRAKRSKPRKDDRTA